MEDNREPKKVSIIIPVYNVEPFIQSCLASVASQTMTEGIECILVDDCGKDKSIEIVEEFINNYIGNITFTLLHHTCNSGPSKARNTGIKNAKGDYLFFLDSDDEISNNCIESLYNLTCQHPGVQLVQGEYFNDSKHSFLEFPSYTDNHRVIKHCLLTYTGKNIVPHNRLVRRDLVIGNNLFFREGIIHEDNLWVFYLAKNVMSMAYCSVPIYHHRYNSNSITGNINIQKTIFSYRIIINDFCLNIDPILPGRQKEHILNTLATVLKLHYYDGEEGRNDLINSFIKQNSILERILLSAYLKIKQEYINNKLLHLLIRLYKLND